MSKLLALDRFGIGAGELHRLSCPVRVRVELRAFEVTASVARLEPAERHPFLRRQAGRWVARLKERFPAARWKVVSEAWAIPSAVAGTVAASRAAVVAKQPGVRAVIVESIPGRRQRRWAQSAASWYCVRAVVAIQIEGQRTGMQTFEDRFMLVEATSWRDAVQRLRPQWREYAKPYLNSAGHLVRWQLEKITDVYDVAAEDGLNGAEVYSKLGSRRMRPSRVWGKASRPPNKGMKLTKRG